MAGLIPPLYPHPVVLSIIHQLATITTDTYTTHQIGEDLQQMLPVKECVSEIHFLGTVGEISSSGGISVSQEDLL